MLLHVYKESKSKLDPLVVQADYRDCLLLEYKEQEASKFILVDEGQYSQFVKAFAREPNKVA